MKFIQGKLGDILQESMQQQWKGVETDKTGERVEQIWDTKMTPFTATPPCPKPDPE